MYRTSLVALERFQVVQYDIYKRVKNTSCCCDGQCSSLYRKCLFHMYLQKQREFPLKFLRKNCGLIVTQWLPSCLPYASSLPPKLLSTAIKVDKMHLKKQDTFTFCTNRSKKERCSINENVMRQ